MPTFHPEFEFDELIADKYTCRYIFERGSGEFVARQSNDTEGIGCLVIIVIAVAYWLWTSHRDFVIGVLVLFVLGLFVYLTVLIIRPIRNQMKQQQRFEDERKRKELEERKRMVAARKKKALVQRLAHCLKAREQELEQQAQERKRKTYQATWGPLVAWTEKLRIGINWLRTEAELAKESKAKELSLAEQRVLNEASALLERIENAVERSISDEDQFFAIRSYRPDSTWVSYAEEWNAHIEDCFEIRKQRDQAGRYTETQINGPVNSLLGRKLIESRELLLEQLIELRKSVNRFKEELELAKAHKVQNFTEQERRLIFEAERTLAWAEGLTDPEDPSDRGLGVDYLEDVRLSAASLAEERVVKIDKHFKEREKIEQLRRGPEGWANLQNSARSKPELLRQRIENLLTAASKHSKPREPSYHSIFDEDELDSSFQEDSSANISVLEVGSTFNIRFQCDELQRDLKESAEYFDLRARQQLFLPLQLAAKENTEWWWFEDKFYKVLFEEGKPSAKLAAELAMGKAHRPKVSLDGSDRVGWLPDELMETVFEAQEREEDDFARTQRMDKFAALGSQWGAIYAEDNQLDKQKPPAGFGLRPDPSCELFAEEDDGLEQVYFESNAHQPPLKLAIGDEQLKLSLELQQYHPLLITRFVGRGKTQRSEAVAEWWWFKDSFYLAKRPQGYQSGSLAAIARQQRNIRESELSRMISGWAEARIPKLVIGKVAEDIYEDGYAPEEIARLVFASQDRQETRGQRFDRIQAAKALLSHSRVHEELWQEESDAYYLRKYEEYLVARTEGYRDDYKQWSREQTKKLIKQLDTPSEEHSTSTRNTEASNTLEEIVGRDRNTDRVNYMDGLEFERFMADLLRRNGYAVQKTKSSGDQGVDLLLELDGRKIAVQLKRYTKPIGNRAIQEVLAGRIHYATQEAWVVTTSSFTRAARELAESTGVRLIDGNELREWITELQDSEANESDS